MYFFRHSPDLELSTVIGHATSEDAAQAIMRLLEPDSMSSRAGDGTDKATYKARMRQLYIKSAVVESHWHLLNHLDFYKD